MTNFQSWVLLLQVYSDYKNAKCKMLAAKKAIKHSTGMISSTTIYYHLTHHIACQVRINVFAPNVLAIK